MASPLAATAEPLSWTGPWVGVTAGVRRDVGATGSRLIYVDPLLSGHQHQNQSAVTGGTLGFSAGYDVQFGSFVGGPIAGIDFSRSRLAGNIPYFGARAGFLATDRILLFVTGGIQSMQNAPDTAIWYQVAPFWNDLFRHDFGAKAGRLWGAFVGAGAEYRLAGNWSVTADYSYAQTRGHFNDLVSLPVPAPAVAPLVRVNLNTTVSTHTFRIGVKYRL
ncbi:outer membrane protein [Phreatobacter stygius]|nr:outer membrane beta-barrel protein [Phreatobacter stygius]